MRVDRVRVAEDWGDLTDGSLLQAIDRDELGRPVPFPTFVWTATLPDGTPNSPNCNDWTGPAGNSGAFGTFNSTDGGWTDNGGGTCNGSHRLYCFEQ